MARHLTGARVLTLGLAAAVLAPLALSTPALAQPAAAHRADPDLLRGRSGHVVVGDAKAPRLSATARRTSTSRTDVQSRSGLAAGSKDGARTATSSPSGVRLAEATPTSGAAGAESLSGCALTSADVNTLTDRSVVHLAYAGATSMTLMRKRDNGTWRTVATVSGEAGTVTDRGVNQRVPYQYRLVAKKSTTVLTDCVAAGYYGTWTPDGWGDPDAVMGGSGGLFQQGRYAQGDRVVSGRTVYPVYSTDGRLVAATRVLDSSTGRAVLEVRRSSNAALVFTVDLGSTVFPADPAFSPDGQTLAFTRYAASTGAAQGLSFVDVFGGHTVRTLATATKIGEPVWRADGTTLVVTIFGSTPGLGLVSSTGTTVTPISGTSKGFTPEVAPNGSIWFAWSDGSNNALLVRTPDGQVSSWANSTTDLFYSPRFTPDGTLYFERDTPDDPVTPTTYTATVELGYPYGTPYADAPTAGATNIGWQRVDSSVAGWDVRQPQSKGTSDVTGEAHHDLVGRDSKGYLYGYRSLGNTLGSRVTLGSGWGGFNLVLAAGDLNNDDQADLVGRDSAGALWLYRGRASGGFLPRTSLGTGWNGYAIVATGDWNGDDKADLVARDGLGRLWLYPGTGRGTLGSRVQIGSSWGGMTAILGSGDVDFDNRADLIARDGAGTLWLYPGNGTGGFLARRQLGTGWKSFTGLAVTEVTYGRPMVWARLSDGRLISYELTGDGVFSSGDVYLVGSGWNGISYTA